ncbi:MAG: flagellar biosynthesis anti-sigma factor FlgM [Phycisphaerales bacterium]
MSELSPLASGQVARTGRVTPASGRRSESAEDTARVPGRDRGSDEVQFSSQIQHLVELKNGGPVRMDLVDRIRNEIEQGSYETPEKVEAAIDELMSEYAEDE